LSRVYLSAVVALMAVVAVLATACGSGSSKPSLAPGDAAAVGDATISKTRIARLMDQARITYGKSQARFPSPSSSAYRGLRGRAVAYLVVTAMVERLAEQDGIVASDSEVAAEVKSLRQQYGGTAAKQRKAMKAAGMTERELEAQARLNVIERKVQAKVYSGVKVTDKDIQKYYDQNKQDFTTPESRAIRQIVVATKGLASTLVGRAESGADFAALARKYSQDQQTATAGGKVVVEKGQLPPAADEAAFSLATGKISEPIKTSTGFQILQPIAAIKPASVTPLSEIAPGLRLQLVHLKQQRALADWQLKAKSDACQAGVAYAVGYRPAPEDDPCTAQPNPTIPPVP
jgi:foldase protein PrsA